MDEKTFLDIPCGKLALSAIFYTLHGIHSICGEMSIIKPYLPCYIQFYDERAHVNMMFFQFCF